MPNKRGNIDPGSGFTPANSFGATATDPVGSISFTGEFYRWFYTCRRRA